MNIFERPLIQSRWAKFICLFSLLILVVGYDGLAKTRRAPGTETATASSGTGERQSLKLPLKNPRIEVHKAERKLFLYSSGHLVRTYKVGLGLSPIGDKVRAGDRRTPEGDFYVFFKNPKSNFYLSLGVSYPNLVHAKRGLRDGLINQAQYDSVDSALKQKKTPLQRTSLGGEIFIHGNGSSSDWTWGCVALENEDVKELYQAVEVGTPVRIKP
jgi:murein L,D-transpeptidase YafK